MKVVFFFKVLRDLLKALPCSFLLEKGIMEKKKKRKLLEICVKTRLSKTVLVPWRGVFKN